MNVVHLDEYEAKKISLGLDSAVKMLESLEQIAKIEPDSRSDVYSIRRAAKLLHQLLGDEVPTEVST